MNTVIENLCSYLLENKKLEFESIFSSNANILGHEVHEFYNFLRRNLVIDSHVNPKQYTEALILSPNSILVRMFINEILILEEVFHFNPFNKKLLGTSHKTDCFGKLAIFNNKIERLLTVRPQRRDEIKNIVFKNINLQEPLFIEKSNLFNDGYYSGHFSLCDDDYKTKIVDVKILTNSGIENQKIVLRGLDYPFFNLNKPIIKNNKISLTEHTHKIYKISVKFINGDRIDLDQSQIYNLIDGNQELIFNHEIIEVYQSINGCAMNYFITNS